MIQSRFIFIRILFLNIALFLFLYSPPTIAQIGFKVGIGVSDIAFLKDGQTPYLGYEIGSLEHRIPRLTFQLGAMSNFELTKRLEFQPELLYILKGLDYSTKYLYDDIKYKLDLHYLELPLLLRYKICIKENKQSGFLLGPYLAWNLHAARVTEIEGQEKKTDLSNVKNIDFGAIVGYSLDIDLLSGQMVTDLRLGYSLVNMMDYLEGSTLWYYGASKPYTRNINISLSVGYRFLNIWSKKAKKNEKN